MTRHLVNVKDIAWGGEMGDSGPVTGENAIARHCVWLALEGKSSTTITSRHGALSRCAAAIAPVQLADAATDDLLRWRMALAGKSETYILAQVSHLRCFHAWLIEQEYRPDNPARRLPVPRKPSAVPHPIGEAELRAAIDGAPDRIRLWLVLAAYDGLRACEIAALRRSCIRENGDRPHIRIAADATKGGYEGTVPLSPYVVAEIRAAGLPATGWAFRRLDGEPGHPSPHRVSQLCNDYLHGLGLADTLHSLRHYFGTEILASTGNVRTAQRALRHRRLDTTAVYTLITDDAVAGAVEAIAPRRLATVRHGKASGAAAVAALAMLSGAALPLTACTHQAGRPPSIARTARSRRGTEFAAWKKDRHEDREAA